MDLKKWKVEYDLDGVPKFKTVYAYTEGEAKLNIVYSNYIKATEIN